MIREAIDALVSHRSLSMEESAAVMREIMEGEAAPSQLGAFLAALRMKGECAEEIAGMAMVMREKALKVNAPGLLVDTCGTGGDSKNTFNISTASAFVAAGAGLRIAKHGNRAFSGSCGSADVLEALGVKIDLPPEGVQRCICDVGIGFMFAPVFHPAMRYAGPVRQEIGIRTVFNMLGPLTNPANAQSQLLGIAHPELGELITEVLRLLGINHALVVHGAGGLDEMSMVGDTMVWELLNGVIHRWNLRASSVKFPPHTIQDLYGGSKEENAAIMRRVFQGERGPIRDAVILNSAAVLVAGNLHTSVLQALDDAAEVIDGGKALEKLNALVELSQQLGQEKS